MLHRISAPAQSAPDNNNIISSGSFSPQMQKFIKGRLIESRSGTALLRIKQRGKNMFTSLFAANFALPCSSHRRKRHLQ
jgi:hypothetical protein